MTSNALPGWIERLLGLETGTGEGTVWSLDHAWPWPPWLTLLVLTMLSAFVVASYLKENPQASRVLRMVLAAMRVGLIGIVLVMLGQFVLSLQRTGLPYVAVVIDDSRSMTVADRCEPEQRKALVERARRAGFPDASRWNLARAFLCEDQGAVLDALREDYKLRLFYLTGPRAGNAGTTADLVQELRATEPTGDATRLGTAIRRVLDDLRGSAPAAVVLLTDGVNTDGPGLAEGAAFARRKGVPLYFLGLGDDRPVQNVCLHDVLVDEVAMVGDVISFDARVSAVGCRGKQVAITLRERNKHEPLATQTITLGPDDQSQQVRLSCRAAEEGEFHYVVEIVPQEGELQTDDNRLERSVRVRNEKVRVLLVQCEPNFEFRYLRNLLARDPTIELKTVLQHADLEYAQQDATALPGFPVRREDLFRYDVVVLGDVDPALLTPAMMQNLVDFVDQPVKGGALVCLAGPRFMPRAYRDTPLAKLLPIDPAGVRLPDANQPLTEPVVIEPTEAGLALPGMQLGDQPAETAGLWKKLPPVYWCVEAPDLKPGARVLAEQARRGRDGRPLPVIVMQFLGAGKVLFHATDETWRWRHRTGDALFARYWIQMLRYLARTKLLEGDRAAILSTERREYRRGEAVHLRLRFPDERLAPAADDGVTVVVESQGRRTERITLRRTTGRGTFEGVLPEPGVGAYHLWVAIPTLEGRAPAADFHVSAPPGEMENVAMDSQEMQRAAEMTRGRFYTLASAGNLIGELPEGHQVPIETLPPKPLWNAWPLLLLFLALLGGEWLLRKRAGML